MYFDAKKIVIGTAVAMAVCSAGVTTAVQADAEKYDAKSVSISTKVDDFINTTNGDPVSELLVTPDPLSITENIAKAAEVDAATATDATATDATATDASLTDATRYPQFQDRAVATTDGNLNIRAEESTDSEIVGTIARGGVMLVKEIGDEWTYVASGSCYGYVKNEFLAYGDAAGDFEEQNNIEKVATINTATLKVRETADDSSDVLTLVPEGESYTVLSRGDNWTEILIDDSMQGFVKNEYVDLEYSPARAVSVAEQEAIDAKLAEEAAAKAAAEEASNNSNKDTNDNSNNNTNSNTNSNTNNNTSNPNNNISNTNNNTNTNNETTTPATEAPATTEAQVISVPTSSSGASAASYACQFVGNPYVWGGSSLTNGADCSGFVMAVYAQFGISLPHNAAAQSNCGTQVSLSALEPGDLIFYSNGGGISHVAMYIGGGQIVHAASSRDGIKISAYNYHTPVKAVRFL